MVQRLGKVGEAGERKDSCWKDVLQLGSEDAIGAQSDGTARGTHA